MAEETSIFHRLDYVVEDDERAYEDDHDDDGGQPFFSWPHLQLKLKLNIA